MNGNLKPAIAELVGTFTLVFIGAGAGALAGSNGGGIVAVALAHGIALMVIIYTWGAASGAHVNPAVTLGIALAGKISWARGAIYCVAQFVGASLAAYILKYLIRNTGGLGATTGSFTGDPPRAIVIEAALTFFLMASVFSSGVAGRNGNAAGLAIGLVLTMDILMGGSLTGASMNPARTFGPALALGDLSYFWIYVVGPCVGAAAAALLYGKVFMRG
ncbi:MAG TPA: aquaporin [Acidobacteriota bacterium]|jgi:aquaporin Z